MEKELQISKYMPHKKNQYKPEHRNGLNKILVNDHIDALFLNVFISCLDVFRATSAYHQEDQVVLIRHLV